MAVVVSGAGGISTDDLVSFQLMLVSVASGAPSATQFKSVETTSNSEWTFTGFGFGNVQGGFPTSGTITGIQLMVGGQIHTMITGLSLPVQTFFALLNVGAQQFSQTLLTGDDTITGAAAAANWLHGFGGNDVITGGSSIDRLYGEEGNDTLTGNDGNDELFGGAGVNTLTGGGGNDTITSSGVGDIIGGGEGQDTLLFDRSGMTTPLAITLATGGALNFSDGSQVTGVESLNLTLGSGNDTFELVGGGNFNVSFHVNGGAGLDRFTADLSGQSTVFLMNGGISGSSLAFSLTGFEEFDIIGGSSGNNLTGGTGNDRFRGHDGLDQLNGGDGSDILEGAGGDDFLNGGAGADIMLGGQGNDMLNVDGADIADGGEGDSDEVDIRFEGVAPVVFANAGFASSAGVTLANGAVIRNVEGVRLWTGDGDDTFIVTEPLSELSWFNAGNGTDTLVVDLSGTTASLYYDVNGPSTTLMINERRMQLSSVEAFRLTGGETSDAFYGGDIDEMFAGRGGNDSLNGRGGDDWLEGGDGNDWLDGGGGDDTVAYTAATSAVRVRLDISNQQQDTLGAGLDVINLFANVFGSQFGDTLSGNENANKLEGWLGNDTLDGLVGDDILVGGDGDDILVGGRGGVNTMIGGEGVDLLGFAWQTSAVYVDMGAGAYAYAGGWDSLVSVDGVLGGSGNDTIFGDAGGNLLRGWTGHDTLVGRDGNDVLQGENGDDWLVGDAGDDLLEGGFGVNVMIGGAGVDLVSYASQTFDLWIDMNAGVYSGGGTWDVFFESIEGVLGGSGGDTIFGNSGNNTLRGAEGNDALIGGLGNDRLEGGEGQDWLVGGDGDDWIMGGVNDVDVLTGGAGADTFDLGTSAGWDVAFDFNTAQDRFSLGGHTWSGFFTIDADGDGQTDDTLLGYAGGNFVALNVSGLTLDQWNALIVAPAGGSLTADKALDADELAFLVGDEPVLSRNPGVGFDPGPDTNVRELAPELPVITPDQGWLVG